MSAAKTVCSRHEIAHEVGAGCPYCVPEPAPATPAPTFEGVMHALKEMWAAAESVPTTPFGRWASEAYRKRESLLPGGGAGDIPVTYGKNWHPPMADRSFGSIPIVADPNCPPGYAFLMNEPDDRVPFRVTAKFYTQHPQYIMRIRLPEDA